MNPSSLALLGTGTDKSTDGRGQKSENGLDTDFTDGTILRICSVRARDSTRHEPGRSLFFSDVGKLLAPDPDWCAVPKSYRPGSLRAEGVVEEEQSVKSV